MDPYTIETIITKKQQIQHRFSIIPFFALTHTLSLSLPLGVAGVPF